MHEIVTVLLDAAGLIGLALGVALLVAVWLPFGAGLICGALTLLAGSWLAGRRVG